MQKNKFLRSTHGGYFKRNYIFNKKSALKGFELGNLYFFGSVLSIVPTPAVKLKKKIASIQQTAKSKSIL